MPDAPDPGGREIEQHRRAEPARAQHEHAAGQQFLLAGLADLVQDHDGGRTAARSGVLRVELAPASRRPVEPKPPSPRALSGSISVSRQARRATGAMTSWAMRSPRVEAEGRLAEIDQNDLDLAAIIGIDGAGAVEQGHAMFERQARARADLGLIARGQGDGDSGRDEPPRCRARARPPRSPRPGDRGPALVPVA